MPALPALLFELETVLVDTAGARRAALRRALEDEGVMPPPTDAEYDDACASLAPREAAATALALRNHGRDDADRATTIDLVTVRAEREFARLVGAGASLAAGARALVEGAAGRARLGVVTRARRNDASLLLSLAGLEDAFECVVAADDVRDVKPSPAPYRYALERLARRGAPATVVAVEDALAGVRAARGAGLRVVAVGPRLAAHVALEADAAVESLAGLDAAALVALAARPHASGTTPEARRR